ncbi:MULTISPECIES: hypothetical protein [unclassified Pseudovibrio]|uniref:hypothetical protein n=1 Tax=unclassified Pseudovibrio TaxID=2627060 RepID=UPI0007B180B5|nr:MULTISPECIES: hypothetical protein [unclassified Pseudovibrio]KZK92536.1 hypothetical protein PsW74_05463 [Pseudovibrio sp. W74]KZL03193.1 hypothetical protein PsAD14_05723 [Pseudovibrio sp. Ad14]
MVKLAKKAAQCRFKKKPNHPPRGVELIISLVVTDRSERDDFILDLRRRYRETKKHEGLKAANRLAYAEGRQWMVEWVRLHGWKIAVSQIAKYILKIVFG